METRQINQVKMYFLIMNSVYQRFEDRTAVVCSYEEKNIVDFYSNNSREPYRDVSGFMRYFDEDSPLYDFNPVGLIGVDNFGHGVISMWVNEEEVPQYINACSYGLI